MRERVNRLYKVVETTGKVIKQDWLEISLMLVMVLGTIYSLFVL